MMWWPSGWRLVCWTYRADAVSEPYRKIVLSFWTDHDIGGGAVVIYLQPRPGAVE
jgi:hypothetical protein